MTKKEIRQEALKAEKERFPRCTGDRKNSFHGVNSAYGLGFVDGALWACDYKESPWISVNEKLPPEEENGLSIKVLVASTKGKIDFSRYDYEMGGWISPSLDIEFTHWMYLPKPTKK